MSKCARKICGISGRLEGVPTYLVPINPPFADSNRLIFVPEVYKEGIIENIL